MVFTKSLRLTLKYTKHIILSTSKKIMFICQEFIFSQTVFQVNLNKNSKFYFSTLFSLLQINYFHFNKTNIYEFYF